MQDTAVTVTPVLIALGANLPGPLGPPEVTLEAALAALTAAGVTIEARSRWWRTAPVPASDQPWFVNGVIRVATDRTPDQLMALLHAIEHQLGRTRSIRNAPRIIDLDLIAFGTVVGGPPGPILPHPRLAGRAFVLLPLAEVAPDWIHPGTGRTLDDLIAALPADQRATAIPDPVQDGVAVAEPGL